LVGRPGLDHGEKQRLMARAAGRMVGGGPEPSAASDVTPRPLGHEQSGTTGLKVHAPHH
jgi:hypothetical protein